MRTRPQITKSARLEEIRLTILNNLMLYHPESLGELAWGPPAASSRDYDSDSDTTGQLGRRSRCVGQTAQGLASRDATRRVLLSTAAAQLLTFVVQPILFTLWATGIAHVQGSECYAAFSIAAKGDARMHPDLV